jgi:hypothetical protein
MPEGNASGTWRFWTLGSNKVVARNHWTALPLPNDVIQHINDIAEQNKTVTYRPQDTTSSDTSIPGMQIPLPRVRPSDTPSARRASTRFPSMEIIEDQPNWYPDEGMMDDQPSQSDSGNENGPDLPETVDRSAPESLPTSMESIAPISSEQGQRQSARNNMGVKPSRFADYSLLHLIDAVGSTTTHQPGPVLWPPQPQSRRTAFKLSVRDGLSKYKDLAVRAIQSELNQLCEKNVFEGVNWDKLTPTQRHKTIRSSLFLKEKHRADGSFDKLKARLVAGGNM